MTEDDGLPEQVHFANWVRYQSSRTQAFARVWQGVMYDVRTRPLRGRDAALGVLLTGILLAASGRGAVNCRAWRRQVEDSKRAARLIKWWIGNRLLISGPLEGSIGEEGEGRAFSASATQPPEAEAPKPRKRTPRKPQVPAPNGQTGEATPTGNWLGPVLEEWREKHGSLPDDQTKGKLMRGLTGVYRGGQTPAQMGERFGIWLAIKPAEKHRYVEDFTSRYGDYDPERCRNSEYLLSLMPALA